MSTKAERDLAIQIEAQEDLYFFSRYMFKERRKYKWLDNWHHRVVCDALMKVFRGSKTSDKVKLSMAQAFANYLDNGSQSATVIFYEGIQPASPSVAADSSKALVTLTLLEPCFKEITATYVELHPSDTATVIKTGTATWARIFNGASEVAADLMVGTDISLANTNLVLGGTLSITSIKLRP